MIKKSVISLISYDAHYLPASIEKYYRYVDEIVLGLDINRKSWSGNKFSFDESALWKQLKQLDYKNKISIIESDFCKSEVAIENDNYERNYLKEQCENDWVFSIDADEWLLNAKEFFIDFCPLVEKYYDTHDIAFTWATPYKQIGDTILAIANEDNSPFFGENQGFVTSKSSTYTYARWTDRAQGQNKIITSPLVCLHWSLCRPKDELQFKLRNNGHSNLADKDPFFSIWDRTTLDNYHELRNFKTSKLGSAQWPKLVPVKAEQIEQYYTQNPGAVY